MPASHHPTEWSLPGKCRMALSSITCSLLFSWHPWYERQGDRRLIWGSLPHLFSTTHGKLPQLCSLLIQYQLPEEKNANNHSPLEYGGTGLGKCGWLPRREDLGEIARVISYWYGNGYKGQLLMTRERKAIPTVVYILASWNWDVAYGAMKTYRQHCLCHKL